MFNFQCFKTLQQKPITTSKTVSNPKANKVNMNGKESLFSESMPPTLSIIRTPIDPNRL